MILINVWAEGVNAILLHRATEEGLGGGAKSRVNAMAEAEDPRVIAGKAVYRMSKEQIALPGSAFARMLREAGGTHKIKGSRKSMKYLVPAAVLVTEDLCGLYLHDRVTPIVDFEVDSRPVTIPATKGRVMRHRARLNEWAVLVTLRINEELIAESTVRQLFSEGGLQIGVGDFRPEKGGPFGTFGIVAWDHVSPSKGKTEAQKRNGGIATRV
jgi:hypothetical protein